MHADPVVPTGLDETPARRRLLVRGAVQGVGFRPFVYREAVRLGLAGWVRNSTAGVEIEVEGSAERIAEFAATLRNAAPTSARIAGISEQNIPPRGETGFTIRESDSAGGGTAEILPDLATCDACLAEMFDPADRRFRYPFINCTQCGPRYSLIEATPYDRSRTSMRRFAMCQACQAEYDDPLSRRFHAEPNACPACGPRLALWNASGADLARDHDALRAAAASIRDGAILAIKGVGGFHLMVDARNEDAVRALRNRKGREEKPFAVMFPDITAISANCHLTPAAERLLSCPEQPIVLLPWTGGGSAAPSVAPGGSRLGAMLPYAPLHHLMMRDLGFPVVATSGNLSSEPIVTDEKTAIGRLAGIADLFLVHDRPIVRPVDDSVAQIVCGEPQLLRRARGYAPRPVAVEGLTDGLLAYGSHLKSTVAISTDIGVVLSQHLGDLETEPAREGYAAALADLPRLHGVPPRVGVRDLHPDYASSRLAEQSGRPTATVQHHVAHVAACLAERGFAPPALGVCWDGAGFGPDGAVWGGEFLHLTEGGWRRVAHLRYFRLPGGEAAIREPRRAALGLLHEAYGERCFERADLAPIAAFRPEELQVLRTMLTRNLNAPLTSSAGRLFDAAAALCGLRQRSSYEGQTAAELEKIAADRPQGGAYDFPLRPAADDARGLIVDWGPALTALLDDLRASVATGVVSARFHAGLAGAIVAVAQRVGEPRVALTGGCFQNVRLTEAAAAELERAGFTPLWHRSTPPNDGGLALGQAAWASWMELEGVGTCA
jgi:hydrogenase maturation protein HypF